MDLENVISLQSANTERHMHPFVINVMQRVQMNAIHFLNQKYQRVNDLCSQHVR